MFEQSQNDPANDPLIIWSNGGPGCSSLLGWLTELGAWVVPDGSDTFQENPWAWNKKANILYFDHPTPVGFSTCTKGSGDCHATDTTDGTDNLGALLNWFKKFPEFKSHDLWLSGESYAGVYMPTLLSTIDTHNNESTTTDKINLKGMMIGNGCTNWTYDTQPATNNMTYWHAIMGQDMYDQINELQCDYSLMSFGKVPGKECLDIMTEF